MDIKSDGQEIPIRATVAHVDGRRGKVVGTNGSKRGQLRLVDWGIDAPSRRSQRTWCLKRRLRLVD